jgi:hypothetical protein
MYELYGLRREPGVPDYDLWYQNILHPDDLARADADVAAALAGEKPYEIAFRAVHPDGSIHHITSCALVQWDDQGRATRIIGINRDRTPQVEAAAQQHRLLLELQHAEKLESLGSLAGGVAHDMNNVLAAILGVASALRAAGTERDSWTRPMDTIIRACTRGRDVVKSLLYFARKDLETMGPVNLNLIAQEVLQLLSYTTLKQVQVSTELQERRGDHGGEHAAVAPAHGGPEPVHHAVLAQLGQQPAPVVRVHPQIQVPGQGGVADQLCPGVAVELLEALVQVHEHPGIQQGEVHRVRTQPEDAGEQLLRDGQLLAQVALQERVQQQRGDQHEQQPLARAGQHHQGRVPVQQQLYQPVGQEYPGQGKEPVAQHDAPHAAADRMACPGPPGRKAGGRAGRTEETQGGLRTVGRRGGKEVLLVQPQ